MLKVTRELIDGIRSAPAGSFSAHTLAHARVAVVARYGGSEDADALLDLFLEAPAEYRRACVLDAVMRAGTGDTARRLASACLSGGRLKKGTQANVLHALGFLGFADARDALWAHAQDGSDHSEQQAASLGLLNLSCAGLEREIEAAIRACVGKNLFPEFLPALACRTENPNLLQTIFDLGRTTASTDCNAGIVYGIALFGDAGSTHFDQLLFDPYWEAYGPGTGTQWWAYDGFRHLGGSLAALARQVRDRHGAVTLEAYEYGVTIWTALAKCWLADPPSPLRGEAYPAERAADVSRAAFDWSSANEDDSLTRWRGARTADRPALYALRDRLDDRITAEVSRDARPGSLP
jgi:hypothetical protein